MDFNSRFNCEALNGEVLNCAAPISPPSARRNNRVICLTCSADSCTNSSRVGSPGTELEFAL